MATRTEGALGNFLEHVVTADGFDDFLFSVIIFVVVRLVSFRRRAMTLGSGGSIFVAVLGVMCILGMRCVFARVLVVMRMRVVAGRTRGRLDYRLNRCGAGLERRDREFARGRFVGVIVMVMIMIMCMRRYAMIVMAVCILVVCIVIVCIVVVMDSIVGLRFIEMGAGGLALIGLGSVRGINRGVLDDVALDPFALTAAAGGSVAGTATLAVGRAAFALFLGLAMGAFVGLYQGLTVGDRYLVIVGMDFAERQKSMAVAAIFDEGRL